MTWTTWRATAIADRLPGTDADAVAALEGLPVARELASSRSTRCEAVELPGGRTGVRKTWIWPTLPERWKGAFRTTFAARSPATRERDALLRLQALPQGPFAPAPLMTGDRRSGGVLQGCVLLLEEVSAAVDLARWLVSSPGEDTIDDVLADLARRVAGMHEAGVLDCDLHPRNVLVQPELQRTWLVDSPKQRRRHAPVPPRRAALDLAALDVGLQRLAPPLARTAFFTAYGAARPDVDLPALMRRVELLRASLEPRQARRLPSRLSE